MLNYNGQCSPKGPCTSASAFALTWLEQPGKTRAMTTGGGKGGIEASKQTTLKDEWSGFVSYCQEASSMKVHQVAAAAAMLVAGASKVGSEKTGCVGSLWETLRRFFGRRVMAATPG